MLGRVFLYEWGCVCDISSGAWGQKRLVRTDGMVSPPFRKYTEAPLFAYMDQVHRIAWCSKSR